MVKTILACIGLCAVITICFFIFAAMIMLLLTYIDNRKEKRNESDKSL